MFSKKLPEEKFLNNLSSVGKISKYINKVSEYDKNSALEKVILSKFKNKIELLNFLIKNGADIHFNDDELLHSVIYAIEKENPQNFEIFEFLLKQGLKISSYDLESMVDLAVFGNHFNMKYIPYFVELILQNQVELNYFKNPIDKYLMKDLKIRKMLLQGLTKKTVNKVILLLKTDIFKWDEICSSLQKDYKITELREYAKLMDIDSTQNKRQICVSLAKKWDNISISDCSNTESILGDPIDKILKWRLFKFEDAKKIYCFDLIELYEYIQKGGDTNPFTRNKLPIDIIEKQYEFLQKIVLSSQLSITNLIEDIKNNPIQTKEIILQQALTNAFQKMHYTGDPNDFLNKPDKYINLFLLI